MPYDYIAPARHMRFVIERVLRADRSWRECVPWVDLDGQTIEAVLQEASRFSREVLLPLNAPGDQQGCRLQADGSVRTPTGFRQAYQAFVEGGWPALPCAPEWEGQGLPLLVDAAVREMLDACNHGWNMYPDLLHGAYETLKTHGSEDLKNRYLADIATGRTLAAMALTEPGAGSDLGALRAKAEPQTDGSWRVSGGKVFISGGDHDLTDQIVHLVLARAPDAPAGTRGISLFLVPKRLPDGSRNAMTCEGLEHKMGIHGSATCAMRYEAATGWLVGELHRGLSAMFLMMNSARLHVGLQGLGHLEMATQNALRYAHEREQGGAPIARHPAMRHTLLRLQALTEGLRCVAYHAALALDEAGHHPDARRRADASVVAALLTPVVKAWGTAQGFEGASRALQVFGGYGYVRETGIEQTVRDARIALIYEGTNEIQAIDLVQRKLLADEGRGLSVLLEAFEWEAQAIDRLADGGDGRWTVRPTYSSMGPSMCPSAGPSTEHVAQALPEFSSALRQQIAWAREGLASLQMVARNDRQAVLPLCDDALAAVAHLCLAWAFAASARAAVEVMIEESSGTAAGPAGGAAEPSSWVTHRFAVMRYGVQWVLPQSRVHWEALSAGAGARELPQLNAA